MYTRLFAASDDDKQLVLNRAQITLGCKYNFIKPLRWCDQLK